MGNTCGSELIRAHGYRSCPCTGALACPWCMPLSFMAITPHKTSFMKLSVLSSRVDKHEQQSIASVVEHKVRHLNTRYIQLSS